MNKKHQFLPIKAAQDSIISSIRKSYIRYYIKRNEYSFKIILLTLKHYTLSNYSYNINTL